MVLRWQSRDVGDDLKKQAARVTRLDICRDRPMRWGFRSNLFFCRSRDPCCNDSHTCWGYPSKAGRDKMSKGESGMTQKVKALVECCIITRDSRQSTGGSLHFEDTDCLLEKPRPWRRSESWKKEEVKMVDFDISTRSGDNFEDHQSSAILDRLFITSIVIEN